MCCKFFQKKHPDLLLTWVCKAVNMPRKSQGTYENEQRNPGMAALKEQASHPVTLGGPSGLFVDDLTSYGPIEQSHSFEVPVSQMSSSYSRGIHDFEVDSRSVRHSLTVGDSLAVDNDIEMKDGGYEDDAYLAPETRVMETKNIKAMGLAAGGKLSTSPPFSPL